MAGGLLYLVPVPLGESRPEAVLPDEVLCTVRSLRYFVVENAKSARAELKRIGLACPIQDLDIRNCRALPARPILTPSSHPWPPGSQPA